VWFVDLSPFRLLGKLKLVVYKRKGLTVGNEVYLDRTAFIDFSCPWLISIGDQCTISRYVTILAHDNSTVGKLGYSKIQNVTIGNRTYIGAQAVIMPGVTIGNDVIIGAGSIVTRNIPNNSVAVGNPARVIESTDEYIAKHSEKIKTYPKYNKSFIKKDSSSQKRLMREQLGKDIGYLE
jgi:maltose O-acetyltransferase